MEVKNIPINKLIPYDKNPRKNDKAADAVAASIKEFGFKNPIVLTKDMVVINGHTRLKAAKKLGMKEVPCIIKVRLHYFCGRTKLSENQLYNKLGYCSKFEDRTKSKEE